MTHIVQSHKLHTWQVFGSVLYSRDLCLPGSKKNRLPLKAADPENMMSSNLSASNFMIVILFFENSL
jgi:hypothetical protein